VRSDTIKGTFQQPAQGACPCSTLEKQLPSHPLHPGRSPGTAPANSWAEQPGTSKHGRSALHTYFKVGNQATSTTGIRVQGFLPSETSKFFHLPSQG